MTRALPKSGFPTRVPNPIVTIPIAAYKTRPKHLAAAIESALRQTYPDFEVIVSDDSPDQSLRALVDEFQDPRVRYRHNSPALGVARNHWSCFREASGEYIAVLNHDDLLLPTFLERLIAPLNSDPNLALAFCDHWVIDADGRALPEWSDTASAQWGRSQLSEGIHRPFSGLLVSQTIPMAMGTVFRRRLLPEALPEDAGPAYDLWLTYLLCREQYGAYYVRERLSSWRAHEGNLTSQGGLDWCRSTAECWQAVARDPSLSSIHSSARRKGATAFYTCALVSWRSGRRRDCAYYGWQSLRLLPNWKGLAVCCLPVVPPRFAARLGKSAS